MRDEGCCKVGTCRRARGYIIQVGFATLHNFFPLGQ